MTVVIPESSPQSPVQILLEAAWTEFGSTHGWKTFSQLSYLAKDPFRWHTVLEAFARGSTWPGTGQGYRMIIGSVFLGERKFLCDSNCIHCGHKSHFQSFLHSVFTALNYPRVQFTGNVSPSSISAGEGFINTFVRFLVDLFITTNTSPFRDELGIVVNNMMHRSPTDTSTCPMGKLPGMVSFFSNLDSNESRQFFFHNLANRFEVGADTSVLANLSISSFFILVAAKGWEAATVEGGRRFGKFMISFVREFLSDAPSAAPKILPTTKTSLSKQTIQHPEIVARCALELVRCSLAAMFIPPTEWDTLSGGSASSLAAMDQILREGKKKSLERCSAFMEPSTVLMILRHMLSRPGAIPNLRGSNEGRFDYSVENIKIKNFDLSRSLCNVKAVAHPPSTSISTPPRADLVLTVKEVNLQIEHDWHIEWTGQKFVSYRGTNTVTVRGLSSQIFLSLFSDDQGPVVNKATISLGSVEHSCKIGNASIVSELLAQTALDWFADPLTKLLQSASQSAIDQLIKDLNLQFRVDVWNGLVLRVFPSIFLEDIVVAIRDHLPAHGVNL